jgi:hypothetical protein
MFFQAMILGFASPEQLVGYKNSKELCINKIMDVSGKGCINNFMDIVIKDT